jgi:hypothetical protein
MAKLVSHISRVMNEMNRDGKITSVPFEESSKIDHELALKFRKIKNDFDLKERKSRSLVAEIELSSLNK